MQLTYIRLFVIIVKRKGAIAMVYAAVLASGSGLRMGGDIPKQFTLLADRPIIIRSIDAFIHSGETDKIYAAVSSDYREYFFSLLNKYLPNNRNIEIVIGGKNRNETLYNVLNAIRNKKIIDSEDVILTHDAVRPFINDRIIRENIEAAREYGACDTVVPAIDTIIQSSDGKFVDFIPGRDTVFHGQTPQTFRVKDILELYDNMTEKESETYTDACSVFVANGRQTAVVMGDRDNIKITYPEDLEKAEGIIARRNR